MWCSTVTTVRIPPRTLQSPTIFTGVVDMCMSVVAPCEAASPTTPGKVQHHDAGDDDRVDGDPERDPLVGRLDTDSCRPWRPDPLTQEGRLEGRAGLPRRPWRDLSTPERPGISEVDIDLQRWGHDGQEGDCRESHRSCSRRRLSLYGGTWGQRTGSSGLGEERTGWIC